jgi:hypothetical protein
MIREFQRVDNDRSGTIEFDEIMGRLSSADGNDEDLAMYGE